MDAAALSSRQFSVFLVRQGSERRKPSTAGKQILRHPRLRSSQIRKLCILYPLGFRASGPFVSRVPNC